jgi:hypothetical protein
VVKILILFKIQGYQIYQLVDGSVSANELNDPDRARLIAQCDIEDHVEQLVNYEFNPDVNGNVPEEKVDEAVVYEIKNFESIILINDNGTLVKKTLPIEVQISPIKSILVLDINQDGNKDIVTVGNHYGVEVETTRYDAGFGAVLLGDGNNSFKYISPKESGFYVPHDSRDIKQIKQNNTVLIFVTNNDNKPSLFKTKG